MTFDYGATVKNLTLTFVTSNLWLQKKFWASKILLELFRTFIFLVYQFWKKYNFLWSFFMDIPLSASKFASYFGNFKFFKIFIIFKSSQIFKISKISEISKISKIFRISKICKFPKLPKFPKFLKFPNFPKFLYFLKFVNFWYFGTFWYFGSFWKFYFS